MLHPFLKKHSAFIYNTSVVLLVIAGAAAVIQIHATREAPHPIFPTQMFYTIDDGATLFADDITKMPPFLYNGNKLSGAYPFTCDGGQHQWVQYLETYGPPATQPSPTTANITIAPAGVGQRLVKNPAREIGYPPTTPLPGTL